MGFGYKETLTSIATALIFFQTTNAELVVKPTDTETLVGELTYFNCSTSVVSQEVQWFHYPAGANGDRNIVYGYNQFYAAYRDRFMIEKNEATGTFNLVITSVQVQHAGKYECQDDVGRGAKASARLIVLDKGPICQINQTTNEVIGPNICSIPVGELQLTCSATYHGDDAPVLKWFEDRSVEPLVDGVSTSSSGNRFLSNLTLKADSIKDGSSFHCRTTRSRLTPHSCTSGSIKIIGTSILPPCDPCPHTKPYVDGILVICLFLIPIIIAASVAGGIYLQTRWRLKIFERLVERKENNKGLSPVESGAASEKDHPPKSCEIENFEPLISSEKNAKTKEEFQQSEELEKTTLELAKNNEEKTRLEEEKRDLEGRLLLLDEELKKKTLELLKSNDDKQSKIDQLETLEKKTKHLEEEQRELEDRLYSLAEELKKKTLELSKSNDDKQSKINQLETLEKKTKHLEEEQRELEDRLYPLAIASYSNKPKLVSVIEIKNLDADSKRDRPIFGMTILRNKLFVVTEKSSEIEVYDSVTFNPEPKWQIDEISNPLDIASCNTSNCLYICDDSSDKGKFLLRVDASNRHLERWSIPDDTGHLSVTREGNVVVSLFSGNKINEYSPDGQLIRETRLSPADNINHPWHAIKTTSMHFIFSHGVGDDPLQRVCVANSDGKIIKSFGGRKGKDIEAQHMNRPVHLLEDSSRNVLVADMKNKRVLILSPTLEYKRILVSSEDTSKLKFPMRLCLDEERGILFVADNNYKGKASYDSGRILIFSCKA